MANTVREALAAAGIGPAPDLNEPGVLDAIQAAVTPHVLAAHPGTGARSIRRTIQRHYEPKKKKRTA